MNRAKVAVAAFVLTATHAFAQPVDVEKMRANLKAAEATEASQPWKECASDIRQELGTQADPRHAGLVINPEYRPDQAQRSANVKISEASSESSKFGTIYYLAASADTGKRARYACTITQAGAVWSLNRLE